MDDAEDRERMKYTICKILAPALNVPKDKSL